MLGSVQGFLFHSKIIEEFMKPVEDIDASVTRVKTALFFPNADNAQLDVEDLDKVLAELYSLRWRLSQVAAILGESNDALRRIL
jgi:Mg2+ and Co2+ transporter CorA